jgi:Na+-transporting NADH:ubiquinone oxidoreductase subunit A
VSVHRIARGLDIPLAGAPQGEPEASPTPTFVAWVAADYVGIKPALRVNVGDRVQRGSPLVEDKRTGVCHTSPATGVVAAIHRGERRALQSIVITVEPAEPAVPQLAFASFTGEDPATLDADAIRGLLVESGVWTALRTRPYSRVPAPETAPHALFITAIDTRPHAPDVDAILAARADDFRTGVVALSRLCAGTTYVCVAAGSRIEVPPTPRVAVEEFAGPHPAGTVGLHIELLDPVGAGRTAWHIGYQDVAAIGHLLTTGQLDLERVISLAGPGALRPRHRRVRVGASLSGLTRGELHPGRQRVISGSVLDGRRAEGEIHGFLGRYHLQVSVIPEGDERELFGWITPGRDKFSLLGVVLGAWSRRRALPLSTTTNGGPRAMVPIGAYERVVPLDIMPTFLLRALITGDVERAEELGALELDEEDLALCTFVCPGKFEYGPLLRRALEQIERESA